MRGFVFMLESVFAGIVLVGFMIFLAGTHGMPGTATDSRFSDALPELDQRDLLREPAFSGDTQSIEDEISLYGYSHKIVLCDISGCSGDPPQEDNVWASSYFLSGEDSISPLEVRLYAWEA